METRALLDIITGGKINIRFEMPVSSTILDVKEQIKMILHVDVGRQTLNYNNEEMMNHKTIADYDIEFSAGLVLEVTPLPGEPEFEILVKYDNRDAKVKVKETTLVAELRAEIGRIWGIPPNNAILNCLFATMEDDDAPLSAYYLDEGSEVIVNVIGPR